MVRGHTNSGGKGMEKSAWNVSRSKFTKLPAAAQHKLLARLAGVTLETAGQGTAHIGDDFRRRYAELQSWAQLDCYTPPAWLSLTEALDEYQNFHLLFGSPADCEGPLETGEAGISWEPRFPVTVALDQVRSPYNVGSVLRLVDNLGLAGIVHASPWLRMDHPRLRRSARGCEQWIPASCEEELPDYLKKAECSVVGVELRDGGTPLSDWQPPSSAILVLGNETYGLAEAVRDCCDQMVYVPMQGYKRSMNVHHALALVAWQLVTGSDAEGGNDSG